MMQKTNTMKNFKLKTLLSFLLFFCLLVTTLVSCKSASVVPPTKIETTNTVTKTEVIRDTVFEIQKDSSYYKAYLECVNGKVEVKQKTVPHTQKGNHLQPPKVNIKDNIITVDCVTEAQRMFAEWKETYTDSVLKSITENPYIVEKELTWWQNTQIILGRIFLGIIILLALVFGLRFAKII